MEPIQTRQGYEANESTIKETMNIVEAGAERLLKQDVYAKEREAVAWGFNNGLLRVKSESEINLELREKPWLKINKTIQINEDDYNDSDTSTDSD
jgi:hypothetical protein